MVCMNVPRICGMCQHPMCILYVSTSHVIWYVSTSFECGVPCVCDMCQCVSGMSQHAMCKWYVSTSHVYVVYVNVPCICCMCQCPMYMLYVSTSHVYVVCVNVPCVCVTTLVSASRCYLFDNSAKLITDPDFITADNLDESKYKSVSIGRKEGEVMKDLIYKHGFFRRTEAIDFQGVCSISPYAPKVGQTLGSVHSVTLQIVYLFIYFYLYCSCDRAARVSMCVIYLNYCTPMSRCDLLQPLCDRVPTY